MVRGLQVPTILITSLRSISMDNIYQEKFCKNCDEWKPLEDFNLDKKGKHGRQHKCKSCMTDYNKIYNNIPKNRNRIYGYNKIYSLEKSYGITIQQYNQMLEEQNYKCKICGKHQSENKTKLAVDHCHETGMVRGLLCFNCNTGLGKFLDSPTLLENALKYLKT